MFLINKTVIVQYVMFYILIILHGAVIWSVYFGENYLAIGVVAMFSLFVAIKYRIKIPPAFWLYSIITAVCYIFSALVSNVGLSSGLNIKTALLMDLNFLVAIVCYRLDKTKAATCFIKITTFFSVCSLIGHGIQTFVGDDILKKMSFLFPYMGWGRGHYGWLLYSFTNETRNYGIYYEPGVHQIILIAALYICIFYSDLLQIRNKNKLKLIILFAITLITTGSTTGYLGIVILLVGVILKRNNKNEKRILWIVLLIGVVMLIDYMMNSQNSLVYTYVISKFEEMSYSNGSYQVYSSGGARMFVVEVALEVLKTNPFFGKGSAYLEAEIARQYWSGFGTGNVLFTTLASKGIVTTLVSIVPIFWIAYQKRRANIQFWVLIAIYINVVFAQTQIMYGVFIFLAYLDIQNNKKSQIMLSKKKDTMFQMTN